MEPRYEELLSLVLDELDRSGFRNLVAAGVVLTGGSSRMEGVVELAEEIFHMPVRLGTAQNVTGLVDVVRNPIYATGVGLLLFGFQNQRLERGGTSGESVVAGVFNRVRDWFQGSF